MAHPHNRATDSGSGTPRYKPEGRSRVFIPEDTPIGLGDPRRPVHTSATPAPRTTPILPPAPLAPSPAPAPLPPTPPLRPAPMARDFTAAEVADLVDRLGTFSVTRAGSRDARLRLRLTFADEAPARQIAKARGLRCFPLRDRFIAEGRGPKAYAIIDETSDLLHAVTVARLLSTLDRLGTPSPSRDEAPA